MKNSGITDVEIIQRILLHCNYIVTDIENIGSCQAFAENNVYQRASTQSLLQIGELIKRVSGSILNRFDNVDWKGLKGFREIVAHRYGTFEWSTVWEIMIEDIQNLRVLVRRYSRKMPSNYIIL